MVVVVLLGGGRRGVGGGGVVWVGGWGVHLSTPTTTVHVRARDGRAVGVVATPAPMVVGRGGVVLLGVVLLLLVLVWVLLVLLLVVRVHARVGVVHGWGRRAHGVAPAAIPPTPAHHHVRVTPVLGWAAHGVPHTHAPLLHVLG